MNDLLVLLMSALTGSAVGAFVMALTFTASAKPEFTSIMLVESELLAQDWANLVLDRDATLRDYVDERVSYLHGVGILSPDFWPDISGASSTTPNRSESGV